MFSPTLGSRWWKAGLSGGGDGLHAGGAVDVGDGGQGGAPLLAHIDDGDHVGQAGAGRDIEPAVDFLQRDGGRERPERFALLDHGVDPVAHFGMAGIGQDAAIAEGARAEFHRAAIPRQHAALRDQLGGGGAGFFQRGEFAGRRFDWKTRRGPWHRLIVVGGTEQRDGHALVGDGAVFGGEIKRGAQRGAVVAGGGLDIEIVEEAGAQEMAIGGAVEGNAARQGEVRLPG